MEGKKKEKDEKIRHLDEKDRRILNILSGNARTKLTAVAKHVNLSVDATKKRIVSLERDGVIGKYTIQPDASRIGLPLGVHIYVRLKNVTKERYDAFIDAMKKNHRVIDLISMMGDYDLYIVMLAKDAVEMDRMKREIRQEFTDLIGEWREVLVAEIYKLEEYAF